MRLPRFHGDDLAQSHPSKMTCWSTIQLDDSTVLLRLNPFYYSKPSRRQIGPVSSAIHVFCALHSLIYLSLSVRECPEAVLDPTRSSRLPTGNNDKRTTRLSAPFHHSNIALIFRHASGFRGYARPSIDVIGFRPRFEQPEMAGHTHRPSFRPCG